jgi:hypothetical protein
MRGDEKEAKTSRKADFRHFDCKLQAAPRYERCISITPCINHPFGAINYQLVGHLFVSISKKPGKYLSLEYIGAARLMRRTRCARQLFGLRLFLLSLPGKRLSSRTPLEALDHDLNKGFFAREASFFGN